MHTTWVRMNAALTVNPDVSPIPQPLDQHFQGICCELFAPTSCLYIIMAKIRRRVVLVDAAPSHVA